MLSDGASAKLGLFVMLTYLCYDSSSSYHFAVPGKVEILEIGAQADDITVFVVGPPLLVHQF